MTIDKTRLLLKHRIGLTMPLRDHESVETMTTRTGTFVRSTISCSAYPPQFGFDHRPRIAGSFIGATVTTYFED